MTSISNSPTTRRSAIWIIVSKIAIVIALSGFVLVSAEGYFDPDHVARIFVSPPTPAFGP